MMNLSRFLRSLLLLLALYCQSVAQELRGTIEGLVSDQQTGESLPSVNVVVKGTYYGAATDINGRFSIENVNAGNYTVEVSLLGYTLVQFTNIKVEAGETTRLDVEMRETVLSLGQDVVIVGERPLFNIEETSTRRSVTSEDIQVATVQNVRDVVSLQAGVVQSEDRIYIRGGRSYETSYLLDGLSVQDPLAGTGFGLQLSASAIQELEVITGGYNAEYGQATSGVINITTKEGGERYSGSVSFKTDNLLFSRTSRHNFNTETYEANLSGPEPLTSMLLPAFGVDVPGEVKFYGNFYAGVSDGYTRWAETVGVDGRPVGFRDVRPSHLYSSIFGGTRFAPRLDNNWYWHGKLTWRPSSVIKIQYSYSQSVSINQNSQTVQTTLEYEEPRPGYQYSFVNILDSAATFTSVNQHHALSWTHTLSPQTFYEAKLSRLIAHVRGDANGRYYTEYNRPEDIVTFPVVYFNTGGDTVGVIPGDGLFDLGSPFLWRDHFAEEFTFKFDLTHHFTEKNKFKSGLESKFQRLQMIDINSPWYRPLGLNNDIYQVYPAMGALYAQNTVTFSGMILNYGLRFDYWFPGKYVDDAVADTTLTTIPAEIRSAYLDDTFGLGGVRWKGRISPRIGISHPVSDNQTLFFSYGHFSKFPRPHQVYSKLKPTSARSTFQTVGNPNLNPETTVAYELGLRNQLTEDDVLTITSYYKDRFDYITAKDVRVASTRFAGGSFTTFINIDYARSRGIEVEYKKRIGRWLRGVASASYSISTGKSSADNENLFNVLSGQEENIRENFLSWDRPWQFSVNVTFSVEKDKPLFGFGQGILDDLNLYVRIFAQAGRRYTPYKFAGLHPQTRRPLYEIDRTNINGAVGDPWLIVDMNFEKHIKAAVATLVLNVEIQNLLNRKNSQIINPVTGRAFEFDDDTPSFYNDPKFPSLEPPISPFPYNPARYLAPRNIKFGISMRF